MMNIRVFGIFFLLTFVLTIGIFIFVFFTIAKTWVKNNNSPQLCVKAKVVGKYTNVSHHHHHHDHHHMSSSTSYYVTFEVESGDRMEFLIPRHEFGLLIEGDEGILTFQGTRYLGFERNY